MKAPIFVVLLWSLLWSALAWASTYSKMVTDPFYVDILKHELFQRYPAARGIESAWTRAIQQCIRSEVGFTDNSTLLDREDQLDLPSACLRLNTTLGKLCPHEFGAPEARQRCLDLASVAYRPFGPSAIRRTFATLDVDHSFSTMRLKRVQDLQDLQSFSHLLLRQVADHRALLSRNNGRDYSNILSDIVVNIQRWQLHAYLLRVALPQFPAQKVTLEAFSRQLTRLSIEILEKHVLWPVYQQLIKRYQWPHAPTVHSGPVNLACIAASFPSRLHAALEFHCRSFAKELGITAIFSRPDTVRDPLQVSMHISRYLGRFRKVLGLRANNLVNVTSNIIQYQHLGIFAVLTATALIQHAIGHDPSALPSLLADPSTSQVSQDLFKSYFLLLDILMQLSSESLLSFFNS
jgi:hypothetical protein